LEIFDELLELFGEEVFTSPAPPDAGVELIGRAFIGGINVDISDVMPLAEAARFGAEARKVVKLGDVVEMKGLAPLQGL
jgi:hypothetical protein